MGNIKEELTKIIKNKNTLTVLIVLIGVVGIYIVYNNQVKQAITTIKVPYAKKEISSRTQITSELIGYTEMPKKVANSLGILTNASQITKNYVKYGYTIPANSFFYKGMVVKFEEVTSNEMSDIPDGYTVYSLDVDINSTYGNSIYTGNYVDLYVKAENENNKIIFGKLFESVKVLAVLDSHGNDVFESSSEARKPAKMWFAVKNEFYTLLKSTEAISGGVKVMPIPRNASYSATDRETIIGSQYIEQFIKGKIMNYDEASNSNNQG